MGRKASSNDAAVSTTLRVAVLVDVSETFFREIVAGVAQYSREVGDWQVSAGQQSIDRIATPDAGHGDGIITSLYDERIAKAVMTKGLPAVAVGSPGALGRGVPIPRVDSDNAMIVAMAFDHLRERGLTTVGYYGVPASPTTQWSALRGDAFQARAAAAGCACARFTAFDADGGRDASQTMLAHWLAGLSKPVGIMACDDYRARQVLEACRRIGLRVPHDVAVIGVDDDELQCELAVPPLTSIAQAARRIGHEAARLLDTLMRPDTFGGGGQRMQVPSEIAIPPAAIVPRSSTETFAVADESIARVIETVRERACTALTIAELVVVAGMSRWKLEKQFKAIVGHSIHDDMARVRLAEAKRLIRTTDLPMRMVAKRSGFRSVAYMTTVFRRRFGITPAAFRRSEQGRVVRLPDTVSDPGR